MVHENTYYSTRKDLTTIHTKLFLTIKGGPRNLLKVGIMSKNPEESSFVEASDFSSIMNFLAIHYHFCSLFVVQVFFRVFSLSKEINLFVFQRLKEFIWQQHLISIIKDSVQDILIIIRCTAQSLSE